MGDKDPVLCEMARALREGRSRLPSATFEESYAQAERSLRGTIQPATNGCGLGALPITER